VTKRVAIIGCSHSDWQQSEQVPNKVGWVEQLAINFPHVEFHSFAKMGHGALWYDFVLKHLIDKYEDYFDSVIVQLTAKGRWIFPLRHTAYDEKWLTENRLPNYKIHSLKSNRIAMTQYGSFECALSEDPYFFRQTEKVKPIIDCYTSTIDNNSYDNFSIQYENLFENTLMKLYSNHFKKFFYFTFFNEYKINNTEFNIAQMGNIGHNKPFVQWAIERYGEKKTVIDIFDNSWHTSKIGEDIFFKEYIMTSNIGKYLSE
jgi:hypothetical protein